MRKRKTIFVYLWEFRIRKGCERRFEKAYGQNGDWVQLFGLAKGYIRTELLKDTKHRRRYITIDHWTTKRAYDTFRKHWKKEFEMLDDR